MNIGLNWLLNFMFSWLFLLWGNEVFNVSHAVLASDWIRCHLLDDYVIGSLFNCSHNVIFLESKQTLTFVGILSSPPTSIKMLLNGASVCLMTVGLTHSQNAGYVCIKPST